MHKLFVLLLVVFSISFANANNGDPVTKESSATVDVKMLDQVSDFYASLMPEVPTLPLGCDLVDAYKIGDVIISFFEAPHNTDLMLISTVSGTQTQENVIGQLKQDYALVQLNQTESFDEWNQEVSRAAQQSSFTKDEIIQLASLYQTVSEIPFTLSARYASLGNNIQFATNVPPAVHIGKAEAMNRSNLQASLSSVTKRSILSQTHSAISLETLARQNQIEDAKMQIVSQFFIPQARQIQVIEATEASSDLWTIVTNEDFTQGFSILNQEKVAVLNTAFRLKSEEVMKNANLRF